MKKLNKLVLRDHISPADLINKNAQKYILGGYGSNNCCYSTTPTGPSSPCSSESDCISKAGANGWWGCNGSSVSC